MTKPITWDDVKDLHTQEITIDKDETRYALDIESEFAFKDQGLDLRNTFIVYVAKGTKQKSGGGRIRYKYEIVNPAKLSNVEKKYIVSKLRYKFSERNLNLENFEFLNINN